MADRRMIRGIILRAFIGLTLASTITTILAAQLLRDDANERAMLHGDFVVASNLTTRDGRRTMWRDVPSIPVHDAVFRSGTPYQGRAEIDDASYFANDGPVSDKLDPFGGGIISFLKQVDLIRRIGEERATIFFTFLAFLFSIGVVFLTILRFLLRELAQGRKRLEETNRRFDTALANMNQGLMFFDAGARLILANRRYCELYGLPPEAVRPGMSSAEIMELRRVRGTHPRMDNASYLTLFTDNTEGHKIADMNIELADGRIISLHKQTTPEGGSVTTHEDITQRHFNEERIAFLANHDLLTNLPNRMLFHTFMEEAITRTMANQGFALFYLDVDQFKAINDTLGHWVGDQLLQALAERLSRGLPQECFVARLGGDEFAIIHPNLSRPEEAADLAWRIMKVTVAAFNLGDHQVQTSLSIGITLSPKDGTNCDSLLKQADMALYRSKAEGRATFRFFEPEMNERLSRRRALEIDLRLAVEREQLEVFYQPMVAIYSGEVIGFEALLRWQHPERGLVSPGDFIPIAEESGLIVPIGAWVLERACEEATRWPDELTVAVNVSPLQFKAARVVFNVREALHVSGLAPHRLELEITESLLLKDDAANLAILHELRSLGTTISMDDFGTGFSSLSYLRSFPFNKIKIDQSFVRDIARREGSDAIIRAMTHLGHTLGMRVLAEGVETQLELDCLRDAGCENAQGYFFSPARPARELFTVMKQLGYKQSQVA